MNSTENVANKLIDVFRVRLVSRLNTDHADLVAIMSAFDFGHLEILRDYSGDPIGYVLFATVNSSTLRMLEKKSGSLSYPAEWKSGRIVYLVDILFAENQSNLAALQLKRFLKAIRCFSFYKRNAMQIKYFKRKKLF